MSESEPVQNPFAYMDLESGCRRFVRPPWTPGWPEWIVSSVLSVVCVLHVCFAGVELLSNLAGTRTMWWFVPIHSLVAWCVYRAGRVISIGQCWWFPLTYSIGCAAFVTAVTGVLSFGFWFSAISVGAVFSGVVGFRAFMRRRWWLADVDD